MEALSTEPVELHRSCPSFQQERGQQEDGVRWLLRQRYGGPFFAIVILAVGMALVPLRVTGISLTNLPGDEIDSHFNLYVLEHGWQWLSGKQLHFWDAPFFYPQPNVIAYSDNHLGTLPLYSLFRFVGSDRETAFQCWFLTLFVLNYSTCLWVLRRWQSSWIGAAAGAYLFAFGLPLVLQIGHVQLIPRFLVPLAAYFGVQLCRTGRTRDWLGLGVCVVWQWYATIYIGYFLALFLAVFLPIYALLYWRTELAESFHHAGWSSILSSLLLLGAAYLSLPEHPRRAIALVFVSLLYGGCRYRDLAWRSLGGIWRKLFMRSTVVVCCCVAMLPLFRPYLELNRERGGRHPLEILCMLPQPASWLNPPACSYFWGRWHSDAAPMFFAGEHFIFFGALPALMLVLALPGFLSRRATASRRLAAAASLAFAVLVLFTLNWRGHSPYMRLIFLPGVSAIRAVTRIVLVLLFPAGVAVACGITQVQEGLTRKKRVVPAPLIPVALVVLMIVEQTMDAASASHWTKQQCQDRVAELTAEVLRRDPAARLFVDVRAKGPENSFEVIRQQLTAMAAAQRLGIPTLNGYSGWSPHGWKAFQRWEQLASWKAEVVARIGEDNLRQRVPGYAQNGFEGLVVIGELESAKDVSLSR